MNRFDVIKLYTELMHRVDNIQQMLGYLSRAAGCITYCIYSQLSTIEEVKRKVPELQGEQPSAKIEDRRLYFEVRLK